MTLHPTWLEAVASLVYLRPEMTRTGLMLSLIACSSSRPQIHMSKSNAYKGYMGLMSENVECGHFLLTACPSLSTHN